jgi:hypothetical protein
MEYNTGPGYFQSAIRNRQSAILMLFAQQPVPQIHEKYH